MSDTLTKFTKKIGDFVAERFKDDDNELFDDISDVVITDFIDKIKKDNPVLGSWVEDWKNKNTKADNPKKPRGINKHKTSCSSGSCGSDAADTYGDSYGSCGMTTRRSYSSGGCGTTTSYYGGC